MPNESSRTISRLAVLSGLFRVRGNEDGAIEEHSGFAEAMLKDTQQDNRMIVEPDSALVFMERIAAYDVRGHHLFPEFPRPVKYILHWHMLL